MYENFNTACSLFYNFNISEEEVILKLLNKSITYKGGILFASNGSQTIKIGNSEKGRHLVCSYNYLKSDKIFGNRTVGEKFLLVDCHFRFATIIFLFILFLPINTFAETVILTWDPNDEPDLAGYSVYGSIESPGPPYSYIDSFSLNEIDPNNPQFKITDLEKNLSYYFVVTAYDTNDNESEPSIPVCVKNGQVCLPRILGPDIKANGSDGPIVVSRTTPIYITVSLDPGDNVGQYTDLWVVAATPYGLFSYINTIGWRLGIGRFGAISLFDLPSTEILNKRLPIGNYTFYFAVDDNADGLLDATWMDSVEVEVQP